VGSGFGAGVVGKGWRWMMGEAKIPRDVREALFDLLAEAHQDDGVPCRHEDAHIVFSGPAMAAYTALESAIARHLPGGCGGCKYRKADFTCICRRHETMPDHYTPADRGEGEDDAE
jgi:hypothetical protein